MQGHKGVNQIAFLLQFIVNYS